MTPLNFSLEVLMHPVAVLVDVGFFLTWFYLHAGFRFNCWRGVSLLLTLSHSYHIRLLPYPAVPACVLFLSFLPYARSCLYHTSNGYTGSKFCLCLIPG